MKVFKFGGASIKDAQAIKNVCNIITQHHEEPLMVVISALGKTTNALEEILSIKINNAPYETQLDKLKTTHFKIAQELFESNSTIQTELDSHFKKLKTNLSLQLSYNQLYDQTVSIGELLSTTLVSHYLINQQGISCQWLDATRYIRTNNQYREGLVDWAKTEKLIIKDIPDLLKQQVIVTQGFIGGSYEGYTTTLGREGSDFSGAIFAYCLGAESLTVWKDVPGILNADPKIDPKAKMYTELPYNEAAEMTFYGASVIHPKTIKPLANKNIPLRVRSFIDVKEEGTLIHQCRGENIMPAFIVKKNQCLVSFKVIDYSFINEENLSKIFKELSEVGLKMNIMQNSAISFSIAIDYDAVKLDLLLDTLKELFEIRYNTGLQLITIKNYNRRIIERYREDKHILLEQISRNNYRALIQQE